MPRYIHRVRDYETDEEEGFLQALLPIAGSLLGGLMGGGGGGSGGGGSPLSNIPIIGPLLGGLLGGGGGGGGGQQGGAAAGGLPPELSSILGAVLPGMRSAGVDPAASIQAAIPQITEIVRGIVGTVPSPVRSQVREALAQADATNLRLADVGQSIVDRVGSSVLPQIAGAMGTLQLGRNQTDATSEHRSIVNRDAFRGDTRRGLNEVIGRLDRIEGALRTGRSRILTGREIDILGGAGLQRASGVVTAPSPAARTDYLAR